MGKRSAQFDFKHLFIAKSSLNLFIEDHAGKQSTKNYIYVARIPHPVNGKSDNEKPGESSNLTIAS